MRRMVVWIFMLVQGVMSVRGADCREAGRITEMTITSPVFAHNGGIPVRYTCDGENVNPPLAIGAVPAAARSLALIVDDPDAPIGDWVHWVVWNIAPATREVGEGSVPAGGIEGRNGWGRNVYGGPCPPSGTHRYFFKLVALDTVLTLSAIASKWELEQAMAGHILARVELVGLYRRQ